MTAPLSPKCSVKSIDASQSTPLFPQTVEAIIGSYLIPDVMEEVQWEISKLSAAMKAWLKKVGMLQESLDLSSYLVSNENLQVIPDYFPKIRTLRLGRAMANEVHASFLNRLLFLQHFSCAA